MKRAETTFHQRFRRANDGAGIVQRRFCGPVDCRQHSGRLGLNRIDGLGRPIRTDRRCPQVFDRAADQCGGLDEGWHILAGRSFAEQPLECDFGSRGVFESFDGRGMERLAAFESGEHCTFAKRSRWKSIRNCSPDVYGSRHEQACSIATGCARQPLKKSMSSHGTSPSLYEPNCSYGNPVTRKTICDRGGIFGKNGLEANGKT